MANEPTAPGAAERVFYRTPKVDVFEDQQALWITAEVPGVAPGNVEVALDDGVLSLTGRVTPASADAEAAKVARAYQRRFTLSEPGRYDAEHVTAVLRNGVLELRLPKAERAKRKEIPVTVQ